MPHPTEAVAGPEEDVFPRTFPIRRHGSGGTALLADVFSDPRRGVRLHHKSGYNVGYVDGHVRFVRDQENVVENLNGGKTYHTDYDIQDYAWKEFFDDGAKKYSLPDAVMSRITIN
ncbi:MAG: H-X9-DG-CTERM domain-containing protein [Planctomycetota bacterium]|jgi:prepilin-type processing-associated H-X9-DG protein